METERRDAMPKASSVVTGTLAILGFALILLLILFAMGILGEQVEPRPSDSMPSLTDTPNSAPPTTTPPTTTTPSTD